jgi:uncharacterized membrane protein YphA (DoxX/SURF4 family)
MEPLFRDLLFLGPFFAPLIIRLGVALLFLWEAYRLSKGGTHEKIRGSWSLLLTLLFAVGLFTQLAAISGIIYTVIILFFSKETKSLLKTKSTALLLVMMLLALIITGAGYTPFPFGDLPY